jgi:sugar/nucleoside kinase (ribokinase family)
MNKKILTIGSAMQDIFTEYDGVETLHLHTKEEDLSYVCVRAGRKIEIKNIIYYCGGGAANSAVSFARFGFDTTIFCKVGTDQAGDFVIKALQAENVSTKNILTTDKAPSGNAFIVPGPQGNSAVLVYRGANITITKEDLPENAIAQADQLYITSLSGPAASLLIPITQLAKKHNKSVAANPGTSQLHAGAGYLKQALQNIDILILNSYEAELLMTALVVKLPPIETPASSNEALPELLKKPLGSTTTMFTLQQFFTTVHACGPKIIVVTNGAEGVYASDKKMIYFHPSIKIDVVSSIGAGDAFGSCFVAQLNNNTNIEDALRAGVINSASVIQHLGTQTGLLTQSEIEGKRKKIDKNLLKQYSLH